MPPRGSFAKSLSFLARGARAGGACLGLALLVFSGDPAAILGLLAVIGLAIGGMAWTAGGRQATWVHIVLLVAPLAAARIAAGAAAAALAAVLLALGVLLRIRTKEVILGLAVFGGIVAAVGGASARVLLAFWLLGVLLLALEALAVAAWGRLRRRPEILKPEKNLSRPWQEPFSGRSPDGSCGRMAGASSTADRP